MYVCMHVYMYEMRFLRWRIQGTECVHVLYVLKGSVKETEWIPNDD